MPFSKGNQLGKQNLGRRKESQKTIWLLESLTEHGFDYESVLVKFLGLAAKGDRHALEMCHLLVKMVPHLANAPKNDAGTTQIDTLVINRFDTKDKPLIASTIEGELVEDDKPSLPS